MSAAASEPPILDDGTEQAPPVEKPRSYLAAHGIGLSVGAATLFLLLRVMAVAEWNWHTAFAIIRTLNISDAVPIVFGTLFAEPVFAGAVVLVLLPAAIVNLFVRARRQDSLLSAVMLVAALAAAMMALTVNKGEWWVPSGSGLLAVTAGIVYALWRRGAGRRVVLWALRRLGLLIVAATLLLASLITSPWMPREALQTANGPVVGYVLQVQPGYLQVLRASDHTVHILNTGAVTSRTILP